MSFVHTLFLGFKKNQAKNPLQMCWRAATIHNYIGNGNNKVSSTEIDAIDLVDLCNEIRTFFDNAGKCHLYVLAQMMYGTMRLFNQQAISLENASGKLYDKTLNSVINVSSDEPKANNKKLGENNEPVQSKLTSDNDFPSLDHILVGDIPETQVENLFAPESPVDTHLMDETNLPQSSKLLDEPIHNDFESDDSYATADDLGQTLPEKTSNFKQRYLPRRTSSSPEDFPIAIIVNQEDFDATDVRIRSQRNKFSWPTAKLDLSSISEQAQTAATPPKRPRLNTLELDSSASQANVFFIHQYLDYDEMMPDADLPHIEALKTRSVPNKLVESSEILHEKSLPLPELETVPALPTICDDSVVEPVERHESEPMLVEQNESPSELRMSQDKHIDALVKAQTRRRGKSKLFDGEKKVIFSNPKNLSPRVHTKKPEVIRICFESSEILHLPSTMSKKYGLNQGFTWARSIFKKFWNEVKTRIIPEPMQADSALSAVYEVEDNLLNEVHQQNDKELETKFPFAFNDGNNSSEIEEPSKQKNHLIHDPRVILERIDNLDLAVSKDKDQQVNRNLEAPIAEKIDFEPVQAQPMLNDNHLIRDIRIILERIDNLSLAVSKNKDRQVNRNEETPIVESIDFQLAPQPMLVDEKSEIVDSEYGSVRNRDENFYDDLLPPAKRFKITSPGTSLVHQFETVVESNEIHLERIHFFRTIQNFWGKKSARVSFQTVVNPSKHTPAQAYDKFIHCLYLAAGGKIKLFQKKAYSTIFLVRP